MMDAAEIARMKAEALASPDAWWSPGRLSLIAALEQAQKDAKDARALLVEIAGGPSAWNVESTGLRARIEAMLK